MAKRRQMMERKLTVADAVSEAFVELEGLAEEMREAFDNTPESLQNSGVGEARGEAADLLEQISEPDIPAKLQDREFTFSVLPAKRNSSRATRRDDAVTLIDATIQFLESIEFKEEDDDAQDRDQLVEELSNMKDEADAVEFPGMYG